VVRDKIRSHCLRQRPDSHCEGGCLALGDSVDCTENLAFTGIRSPTRQAPSGLLDRVKVEIKETEWEDGEWIYLVLDGQNWTLF
jgi:hypothetical protein